MPRNEPVRIIIADDHTVVRAGLRAMIETEAGIEIVAEATTGREALTLCTRHHPDVLVTDLQMPQMDGYQLTAAIKKASSATGVVVLTVYEGDQDIYRALQAGASAYVPKNAPRDELIASIRAAAAGRKYLPHAVADKLVQHFPASGLSDREIQVLQGIADGQSSDEIARMLHMTVRTVKAHVGHILEKLGARDRTQALGIALRRGIIRLK